MCQPSGNCWQAATSRQTVSQILLLLPILILPPFETHTRILHLLRATNMKKAILVLQSSEWIQHIATAFTKAITSHKIYFLFWGPGSQTGYFLPFTYLIRSCCSSGFLDCLYLSEISFHISPASATLSRLPVIKCKKQNTCPVIQLLW